MVERQSLGRRKQKAKREWNENRNVSSVQANVAEIIGLRVPRCMTRITFTQKILLLRTLRIAVELFSEKASSLQIQTFVRTFSCSPFQNRSQNYNKLQ